ncbi:transposase domain-containing protein [Streptomyces sp. NPDC090083]|uniref:transposase domain-containing protein n=1 Tax=Streptomyces sp. NPDC090083 TaxID=3365941 RepID=UPI0037F9706F
MQCSRGQRRRLLSAQLVVYFILALALFSPAPYLEVMRHLVEGLRGQKLFLAGATAARGGRHLLGRGRQCGQRGHLRLPRKLPWPRQDRRLVRSSGQSRVVPTLGKIRLKTEPSRSPPATPAPSRPRSRR